MQVNEVNEKIKVGVVFDSAQIIPKWFFWGNKKYDIFKVEHTWKTKQGETPLIFFAVSDNCNLYELKLNQKTLEWRLERVYIE
ncbi:MAG: hypothetical protein HYT97_02380 [Elusimicrobia bacterium]|nr:hypothetical protein [Elusimicrobiota bacterium]